MYRCYYVLETFLKWVPNALVWENGRRNGAARQNSEIGRIECRMIRPNDPVGGEGKVGRGRQKVGCRERQSR